MSAGVRRGGSYLQSLGNTQGKGKAAGVPRCPACIAPVLQTEGGMCCPSHHHFNLQPLVKADGLEHADRSFPTQFQPRLFIDGSLTASGTSRELLPPCWPAVLQLPSCIPARLQNRLSGRAPWFRQLQKEVLCLTPHASRGKTIARGKKRKVSFFLPVPSKSSSRCPPESAQRCYLRTPCPFSGQDIKVDTDQGHNL